jgi:hypothetical protein
MLVRFRTNANAILVNITRPALPPNTDDIFTTNGKYGMDLHLQESTAANFGNWRCRCARLMDVLQVVIIR